MEAMEMKEIEAAVEGILFASGEPVAAPPGGLLQL